MAPLAGSNGKGFTLLEAVAALAILGVGLSILYAGYIQANQLQAKGADTANAFLLARSVLARAEAGERIGGGGDFSGWNGYEWSLDREPADAEGLVKLIVTVYWDKKQHSAKVWGLSTHAP